MNRKLYFALFIFSIIAVLPVNADWILNNDGKIIRSQVLGKDTERKQEKQEDKKEGKKEEKIELQQGSVQLKIDKENGVLKVKSKNEKGEEFEMETKNDEKVKIEDGDDDVELTSGEEDNLKIVRNEIEAETQLPVSVDTKTKKLSVEGKEIIMPDVAVRNAFATGSATATTKVELKNLDQKTVYEINRDEKKKLFGFIDMIFHKASVVSAENGIIIEDSQVWWNKLLENFAR